MIERSFKKPEEGTTPDMVVFTQHNNVSEPSVRQMIDNGQHGIFPLHFKSVLFNVSVVDSRFSKEFKIFYSFSKDQSQIIGCENFFNMTQLSTPNMIHLKVRVSEDILHAAVLHFLAGKFQCIAKEEIRQDPEIEMKVPYCIFRKENDRRSNESRRDSPERRYFKGIERADKYGYKPNERPRYGRRPSTPPSALKRNLRLDYHHPYDQIKSLNQRNDNVRNYLSLPYYDFSFLLGI